MLWETPQTPKRVVQPVTVQYICQRKLGGIIGSGAAFGLKQFFPSRGARVRVSYFLQGDRYRSIKLKRKLFHFVLLKTKYAYTL